MDASVNFISRLMSSIREERNQMLQPIGGYEKETLLPLREACKPLAPLFDEELQTNITIALMNCALPKDGLTQDESAAIYLYTMEWSVKGNSLYYILNRALRNIDRRSLFPWHRYLKLFLTAFFKLPRLREYETIWRAVAESLANEFPKGKEVIWWQFSSCTASLEVLKSSAYLGKATAGMLFSISTKNARDIRNHSYFSTEDEMILPPGSFFRVLGQLSQDNGVTIVQMRETEPPYITLVEPFDLSQWNPSKPSTKAKPKHHLPLQKSPELDRRDRDRRDEDKHSSSPLHTPKSVRSFDLDYSNI